jgi:hypothetical protein
LRDESQSLSIHAPGRNHAAIKDCRIGGTMSDTDINDAIALLRSRGFSVSHSEAEDWITPIDLWREHGEGVTLASFRDRLTHP